LYALRWLWASLALPINEINDLGAQEESFNPSQYKQTEKTRRSSSIHMSMTAMELDPYKLDGAISEAVMNENALRLKLYAQHFLTSLTEGVEDMPKTLRALLATIKEEVAKKFPDYQVGAVANFLFLKLVCPAMLTPHIYGITPDPPNENAQRYLILLSKSLHNLSTGTKPSIKEPWMEKMDDFVTSNQRPLTNLVEMIVDKDEISAMISVREIQVSNKVKMESLSYLHSVLYERKSEILQKLSFTNSSNLESQLRAIIEEIGEPNKKE